MSYYMTTERTELNKLTYIDMKAIDDRVIPLLPFLNDQGHWELWVRGPNGLIDIHGVPVLSDYVSRHREQETDVYFEFINVMTKHTYWKEIVYFVDGIRHDFHNLGASLAKIDLFFELYKEKRTVSLFVATETEYIFTVCKSIYDLLQEVISGFWQKVQLTDIKLVKRNLPNTFHKMVMYNDQIMSINEIEERYQLPTRLAMFYYDTDLPPIFGPAGELVSSGPHESSF
jgi:hypothetical protein